MLVRTRRLLPCEASEPAVLTLLPPLLLPLLLLQSDGHG
jgi:hypothetical protein